MRPITAAYLSAAVAAIAMGLGLRSLRPRPVAGPVSPAGGAKHAKTRLLETGSSVLQGSRPLEDFDIYMVGFHPAKDDPEHQCEAHHFCRQVNEDFIECVLFDGNTDKANLIGIEYIISERLFESLPAAERPYWHPHNAEILSGQLIAPGLPAVAEKAFMASKMNSYGKTWHLWDTGSEERPGKELPFAAQQAQAALQFFHSLLVAQVFHRLARIGQLLHGVDANLQVRLQKVLGDLAVAG